MMNTVLAICITGVFSSWVWKLKQQVSSLQLDAGAPVERMADLPLPQVELEKTAPPSAQPSRGSHVSRNHQGVPTWVIG